MEKKSDIIPFLIAKKAPLKTYQTKRNFLPIIPFKTKAQKLVRSNHSTVSRALIPLKLKKNEKKIYVDRGPEKRRFSEAESVKLTEDTSTNPV